MSSMTMRAPTRTLCLPSSRTCTAARPVAMCAQRQEIGLVPTLKASLAAGLAAAVLLVAQPGLADLNKREAAVGGEFGTGTAAQYGEATINGRDFSNQDLRRSNFTSAEAKKANFRGAKLNGTYFIKTVATGADFTGADVSDALWDRSVIVNAILRDAILERVIFTASDLTGADIYGADFTNAILDRPMQMKLCRYADGVNPTTGAETRKSLGCGSRRAFRASSPSSGEGPAVSEEQKEAFRASISGFRDSGR